MAGGILADVQFETYYIITLFLLFTGLILLLAGFLLRKRRESHLVLIFGWVIFGAYWLTQIPHFLYIDDVFNAIFCGLGFLLFIYFAYHEILNYKWDEYLLSLNYIAGIVAVGGLFYYMIEKIEPLAKGLIYIVAQQSVGVYNLFNPDVNTGKFCYSYDTQEFFLPIPGTEIEGMPISIILACTGIQSIAIFVGILAVTRSNRKLWVPWTKRFLKNKPPEEIKESKARMWLWQYKKKRFRKVLAMSDRERYLRVFLYTVPVIYILNIFRNSLIMYGHVNSVLGPNTFDIAHNYLSKFLSLVVLIILVFIVFELLPECQEGIIGLIDLQYRNKRGMVKDEFVDVKSFKKGKHVKDMDEEKDSTGEESKKTKE